MTKSIVKFLKQNLYQASLQSFGVKNQFIELEFVSNQFEEIMFFVDCAIFATDSEIVQTINALKKGCQDTFEIGYFVFINRKPIISVDLLKERDLSLVFSENLSIVFDLNSRKDSNLSITFREKKDSSYVAIDLNSDSDFRMESISVV